MTREPPAGAVRDDAGVAGRAGTTAVLDLHLRELRQIFNELDPAPFRERDLDPAAASYIVDWAGEQRPREPLALRVHVAGAPGAAVAPPANADLVRTAVQAYFVERAAATRLALKRLFRDGRISLAIGIGFLAVAIIAGEIIAGFVPKESYASIVKESFVIGGWVALWRPMEVFFYDWWPILREARLYDRLGVMDVRVLDAGASREVLA